jgi:sulfofructose kinase
MKPEPIPKATNVPLPVDVLCVGVASYDLIYTIPSQPGPDAKMWASALDRCGGGPAANAAVTVSRLGFSAAFAGYLGDDAFGDEHYRELQQEGVKSDLVVRGSLPTSLSAILVKPDGARTIVNYAGGAGTVPAGTVDFSRIQPKVILFDGHEPFISPPLARTAKAAGIKTVLDAGHVRQGTADLLEWVDYAVCSAQFSREYTGLDDPEQAVASLAGHAPHAVITLGDQGLVWHTNVGDHGRLPAYPIEAIDTTGAGDSFHGAFAAGVAAGWDWPTILEYASATAALCCTRIGGRHGIPTAQEVKAFLDRSPPLDVPRI